MKNPYFSLIASVWHYGKPWRKTIVVCYFAFTLAQIALSLTPYTFGRAIGVLQNFSPGRLQEVVFWLAAGVVVTLIFWLFHGPARVIERRVALHIQQNLRLHLYQELTRMPLGWHQNHHSGNIITRLNRAAIAIYKFSESQFIYIQSIVRFIVSVGFLLWISIPVGLITLVASVLITLTVILFDKKLIPLYDEQNEIDNHVGAVLFDYISNMTTVITLRLGQLTYNNLYKRMMGVWPYFSKDAVLNEVKWFTMGTLLSLLQAAVLIAYILHSIIDFKHSSLGYMFSISHILGQGFSVIVILYHKQPFCHILA